LAPRVVPVLIVLACVAPSLARAATADPHVLAAALQRDPVQKIGASRSAFSALSAGQVRALRAQIAKVDPGRLWIAFVAPRTQSALGDLASPVFNVLPPGALIAIADDPNDATTTHFWVGATWEDSGAAQSRLNDALNGANKGQDPLIVQLKRAIDAFASGDAAAGHPPLAPAGGGAQPANQTPAGSGGGSNGGLIAGLIVAAIVLLTGGVAGGKYLRGTMRASHRRKEEIADTHERANADFVKLGEEIEALDIDSSMPNASARGKDEYGSAIECYQEAERHLQKPDDDFHFEHAVDAIKRGREHVHAAARLFSASAEQPDA
jgi:hypothetical protein